MENRRGWSRISKGTTRSTFHNIFMNIRQELWRRETFEDGGGGGSSRFVEDAVVEAVDDRLEVRGDERRVVCDASWCR